MIILFIFLFFTFIQAECPKDSLSSMVVYEFKKDRITCKQNGLEWFDLCDSNYVLPHDVTCEYTGSRESDRSESLSSDQVKYWTCNCDDSWIQEMIMICDTNTTSCNTIVSRDCRIEVNPIYTAYYMIGLMIILSIAICCIICVILCGWATHCFFRIDSTTPSYYEHVTKTKRINHQV
jgi:hypothetical protein